MVENEQEIQSRIILIFIFHIEFKKNGISRWINKKFLIKNNDSINMGKVIISKVIDRKLISYLQFHKLLFYLN